MGRQDGVGAARTCVTMQRCALQGMLRMIGHNPSTRHWASRRRGSPSSGSSLTKPSAPLANPSASSFIFLCYMTRNAVCQATVCAIAACTLRCAPLRAVLRYGVRSRPMPWRRLLCTSTPTVQPLLLCHHQAI